MKIQVPAVLKELAEKLSKPIYLVGGFVRNSLFFASQQSTDIDITGSLTPDEIALELEGIAQVKAVNPRIGTVLIIYKGEKFEYTTFREDSYPIGGYHTPTSVVFIRNIEKDVLRRDFTINAMYCDVKTGEVVDILGGLIDLKKKQIRTVRSPERTFGEDGLRLLRLVRFASELTFNIEPNTAKGTVELANQLKDITSERKREELERILHSIEKYGIGSVYYGIKLMAELLLWDNFLNYASIKDIPTHIAEYELLDTANSDVRLPLFAYLTIKNSGDTIDDVFGVGLKYSNQTLKELNIISEFILSQPRDEHLMYFLAQNKFLVDKLEGVAKALNLNIEVKKTFDQMLDLGLPLKANELKITESDFKACQVKGAKRKYSLTKILLVTYKQKRLLSKEEKLEILRQVANE